LETIDHNNLTREYATISDDTFALLVLEKYMRCMYKNGFIRVLFKKKCATRDNTTEETTNRRPVD